MKIYKKLKSIIFYMSIEEQKRDLIEEKNKVFDLQAKTKQTERERELNLRERKLEERENILEQKEEILLNAWGDIQYIRDSIYDSLEIFDNRVSDELLQLKGLLNRLRGYNFKK